MLHIQYSTVPYSQFCVCIPAEADTHGRSDKAAKVLELFSIAQRMQDAEALSSYLTLASAAAGQQGVSRLEAARIIAGLKDANTVQLHNLAVEVVQDIDSSRSVLLQQVSAFA